MDAANNPPMPSADKPFYEESLRASMRSLGRLIRSRRKLAADPERSAIPMMYAEAPSTPFCPFFSSIEGEF